MTCRATPSQIRSTCPANPVPIRHVEPRLLAPMRLSVQSRTAPIRQVEPARVGPIRQTRQGRPEPIRRSEPSLIDKPVRHVPIRQAWPHRPYSTRPTATRHAPSTFRSHNAPVLSWPIRRFEPTRANSTSRVSPDPFDIPSHALPGRLAEPARSQSPSTRRAGPAPFDTPSLYPSYSTRPAVADLLDIPRLSQSHSTIRP